MYIFRSICSLLIRIVFQSLFRLIFRINRLGIRRGLLTLYTHRKIAVAVRTMRLFAGKYIDYGIIRILRLFGYELCIYRLTDRARAIVVFRASASVIARKHYSALMRERQNAVSVPLGYSAQKVIAALSGSVLVCFLAHAPPPLIISVSILQQARGHKSLRA